MTARSHHRGHAIFYDTRTESWRYADNWAAVKDCWQGRPCGRCNQPATPEGHDPCIADLPGVLNACCGHGQDAEAYAQLESGGELRGRAAMAMFREAGRQVPA